MWVYIYRSSILILGMQWTISMLSIRDTYCFQAVLFFYNSDLLWYKIFKIGSYWVLHYSILIVALWLNDIVKKKCSEKTQESTAPNKNI